MFYRKQMTETVHPNAVNSPHNIEIVGRAIGLRKFMTDCLEKKFFFFKKKREVLRQEYNKNIFMTIFVIDSMGHVF